MEYTYVYKAYNVDIVNPLKILWQHISHQTPLNKYKLDIYGEVSNKNIIMVI